MAKSKLSPAPKKTAAKPATIKANRVSVSECGPGGSREKSVSIRKIENGYIVSESTYGGKGGYKSTERFSPTAPTVQIAPSKGK